MRSRFHRVSLLMCRVVASRGGVRELTVRYQSFLTSLGVHAVGLVAMGLIVVAPPTRKLIELMVNPPDPELSEPMELLELSPPMELAVEEPEDLLEPTEQEREAFSEVRPDLVDLRPPRPRSTILEQAPTGDLMMMLPETGSGDQRAEEYANDSDLAEAGKRVAREGGKSGDVQISLMWNSYNDLDLHVRGPSGELVWWRQRRSYCGGMLDVDMNVLLGPTPLSTKPVENVFWPKGAAAQGSYRIAVHHFSPNGQTRPVRYTVVVKVAGQKPRMFRGKMTTLNQYNLVHEFTIP